MAFEQSNNEYILSMNNITKIYDNGFVANEKINLKVKKGEIHALMGENGAGKSTLMKILFGQEHAEEGNITYKGEEISVTDPLVALKYGIGMVHQHFMLVPSMTVAENMVLGMEPKEKGLFNFKEAVRLTHEVSEKYKLPIDPLTKVEDLTVGYKQRLEILKILSRGVDVLILDEPTAVLTPQETEELFVQLKNLKNQGFTIIFISHKLHEIKELCDNMTILRHGKVTGIARVEDLTEKEISRLMVGRDVLLHVEKTEAKPGNAILKVEKLNYKNRDGQFILKDLSFQIRQGEILGIAGIEGNGQRELSDILSGLQTADSGNVYINDKKIDKLSVREIRELGLSHISEDRMSFGSALEASIEENIISDRFYKKEYNKNLLLNQKMIRKTSEQLIEQFQIKCDGPNAPLRTLSGGNIQKVVSAREFSSSPVVLIANQPTRGIDVGASEFIRKRIVELRDEGAAVLLISADLTEIVQLSDNIAVLNEGEFTAYIPNKQKTNDEILGEYMLGIQKQTEEEVRRVNNE